MSEDPPSKPGGAPRCLVCAEGLGSGGLVLCAGCRAPHHERCWGFNKGCATYACGSRVFVEAPGPGGEPTCFEVRGQPSPFALGLVVVTFGVVVAALKPYWFVSKALAKPLLKVLKPLFWTGVVGSLLAPLATRRRVLLDPGTGTVGRQLLLGPIALESEAAEVLDSTLRLPAGMSAEAGLESRALRALPGRGPGALPEA